MPQKKKGRNPSVSKGAKPETAIAAEIEEQPQCHIHDEVGSWEVKRIRQKVCVNDLPLTEHTDGKHYCLFHLSTQDKDKAKFEEIFRARLNSVNQKVAEIEELPEEERKKIKRGLSYNFHYVWFPSEVNLRDYEFQTHAEFHSAKFSSYVSFHKTIFSAYADFDSTEFSAYADFSSAIFSAKVDFKSAVFSAYADFRSAEFSADANFNLVRFSSIADFNSAIYSANAFFNKVEFLSNADFDSVIFSSYANFNSTKFSLDTYFDSAIFLAGADFSLVTFSSDVYFLSLIFLSDVDFVSATFLADASFDSATFSGFADFRSAEFEETSQIFFKQTSFQGIADFRQAVIKGYLYFEAGEGKFFGSEWLDEEKTKPKIVRRRTSVFENRLDFAHVRAEKPERITFNKVRLRPNWFVNIDSRKFVFTDIAWENHRARKRELKQELINLTRRKYKKPHNYQLLTVAFRNLAANAEEFNRFEQASDFRKSASECERLERINRQRKLWRAFKSRKGKSVFELWQKRKEARFDFVHFLYRWLSYYGENWRRAFLWLWVIWIVFALGFYLLGEFGTEQNREYLGFGKSFAYSLFVMTLQKPDPRPLSTVTYILYGLETIFAPVQAALLALAIRRKFMR